MRIAFITHQFFPAYYTGVERLTLNLATQLTRMGHECTVITSAEHSNGDAAYPYAGLWVQPVKAGESDLARPWLQDPGVGEQLGRLLDQSSFDVIHVMHPMRLPQIYDEAFRRNIPVVTHAADFGYLCARINLLQRDGTVCTDADNGRACQQQCNISSGPERIAWGRKLLQASAAVVCPCRHTIDLFGRQGFNTSNWHCIPWGVDYSLYPERLPAPTHDQLVVGFMGTLLRHKGPHVLVEAIRLLEGRNIELRLYGGSFHEDEYEREVRALAGSDPRIRFEGSYTHEEFHTTLAPVDVVAIPSLWLENLPTTGLNAVAAGVPLIVSQLGGSSEIIDDYDCGFVVPAGDAKALAGLLESLLDDRQRLVDVRERMAYPPGLEEEAWKIETIYRSVARKRSLTSAVSDNA